MNALQVLARKARLAIGLGVVRLVNDASRVQSLQVSLFRGEVRDNVNRYQNYGFTSRPRESCEAVVAAVGGSRNHLVALVIDDPGARKKNLEVGEVAVYHHEGAYVLFKNGGEIEVISTSRVRVAAPEITVEGEVTITGNLTVSGTVQGDAVKTAAGVDLGTHQHGGIQRGSSASDGPQ